MTARKLDPAFLDLDDAAIYVGVSVDTIRRWISDGEIAGYRLPRGRLLRVRRTDLDALITSDPVLP